ncbi:hypothetical protein C8R44DRAFT_651945 [Mycena epipterygia]|nr:hypothetical protein C8R44DRAFT_651945 [Mycena epipterygia]
MFTFPPPPSLDMETMDEFPVVDLYDDPAEMEVFLKAIFDSDFFMPPPALTKFEDIVGILRLSHKYDVPFLRRRALKHLGTLYHTRLSERDSKLGENSVEFAQSLETTLYNVATIKVWRSPRSGCSLSRTTTCATARSRRSSQLARRRRRWARCSA